MRTIFLCIFLLGVAVSEGQVAKKGKIDLLLAFDKATSVSLDGEWEFFWDELIDVGHPESDQFTAFPSLWTDLKSKSGDHYPSFGCASYRLTVCLDTTIEYAIFIPAVYNSFAFYINGELISKNGEVGKSKEETVPFWLPITTEIPSTILKDTNEFVLQIANYRHYRAGGIDKVILGRKEELIPSQDFLLTLDKFLIGALFMGGLFFLGLYFFGRKQKSMLYFSFFNFVVSYYIAGSGNYVLHEVFPNYSWFVAIRVEFIAIYVITVLLVKFTESVYPKETPKYLTKLIIWISSTYILFAIFLPITVFTKLHNYFLFIMVITILYGLIIYIRAAINKRVGAVYGLLGVSFLLAVFLLRIVNHQLSIYFPPFLIPLGYMVYFFLHGLTLSQQFAIAWKTAKDNAEEALRAKSNFLSTMSHEIRTPMNAVIGLTNHIIEDSPKEEHKDLLETLKFSSQNLLVLINDILDLSKIESNKVEFDNQPVNLKRLMDSLSKVFEPIAKQKDMELVFSYDKKVPENVLCDATRTSQVLTNLIGNAIKFTHEGHVKVSIELIRKAKNSCNICFTVEDTGIGIPKEKLSRIFDSFTQASSTTTKVYGGTGLGLSISKKLLELQGVELKVESEVGKGSRFFFEHLFKIAKSSDVSQKTYKKPSHSMVISANVLLVEDNDINILVAMKFLSKWGLTVDIAKNGQEALDMLDERKNSYDVILMDLQMPIMDGYTASKEIRNNNNNIPIIALTASALPEERAQMFQAGMDDYVLKPFEPDVLFETLSKYVENKN